MFKLTGKLIKTVFTFLLILLVVGFFLVKKFTEPDSSAGDNKSDEYYTVVRVVDGDTFET